MGAVNNQGFAKGFQGRGNLGKGAMGDRSEAFKGPIHQGQWNQGQGGRSREQQGNWSRADRRPAPETRQEDTRERALVISEGKKANPNPNPDVKFFRCLGIGHFQVDCTNEPVCFKCKEKGHLAVDCYSSGSKKLKMFGFGIPGQGFYAFNFPDSKIKVYQATGLLTILAGDASEEKVDKELRNLVKENWDFKVKQIHIQEYLVIFPDKGSLETFSKLSEFQMPLYGLKGKIEKTARDYATSSMLHTVWIKVHGVPDLAREVDHVKEIVSLVAEPIAVDELSLIKEEPIRVQGRCRNPGAIRGSIEIFFNGVGKQISFEVEGGLQGSFKGGKGGPPGSGKPDDPTDRDKDHNHKGDKPRKSTDKFDRIGKIDKDNDSGHEESMEEELESVVQQTCALSGPMPIAAYHPSTGLVVVKNGEPGEKDMGIGKKEDQQMTNHKEIPNTLEYDPNF